MIENQSVRFVDKLSILQHCFSNISYLCHLEIWAGMSRDFYELGKAHQEFIPKVRCKKGLWQGYCLRVLICSINILSFCKLGIFPFPKTKEKMSMVHGASQRLLQTSSFIFKEEENRMLPYTHQSSIHQTQECTVLRVQIRTMMLFRVFLIAASASVTSTDGRDMHCSSEMSGGSRVAYFRCTLQTEREQHLLKLAARSCFVRPNLEILGIKP